MKSTVSPLSTGIILSYSVYQYSEKGILEVLPLIDTVIEYTLKEVSPNIAAIYAIVFILVSMTTTHFSLRSGRDDLESLTQ